jgi:hypothetical protein
MGIPNTYNGLVSAVIALAEDDSTEFAAYIPTAIFLSEERLIKELDTESLITTVSITGAAGDNTLTKPTGHRLTREITVRTSAGNREALSLKTNDFIRDYWPAVTSTSTYPNGQPKYYANEDGDNWVLAPTPASAYNYTVQYTEQLTHVSTANQTNYFTDFCSDALYYGTMVGMAEFMKDYTVRELWEGRYQVAVQTINNQGRRERRDDSTSPRNPSGGPNTLTGAN